MLLIRADNEEPALHIYVKRSGKVHKKKRKNPFFSRQTTSHTCGAAQLPPADGQSAFGPFVASLWSLFENQYVTGVRSLRAKFQRSGDLHTLSEELWISLLLMCYIRSPKPWNSISTWLLRVYSQSNA
jgi:hypothetical protein